MLSMGGRITLAKTVLGSLPLYLFSLFRVPSTVHDHLEKVHNNFIWGSVGPVGTIKKMVWARTEHMCVKLMDGGLNVRSFKAKNISLLRKWWWCFLSESDSLWKRVIISIYGHNGGLFTTNQLVSGGP